MTNLSFNLLDEPWIMVRNLKGEIETVSMLDAFARSQEFRGLSGELPSQDFAVLRVMLAVLYRIFNAEQLYDPVETWEQLWLEPALPMERIESYLEQHRERFDLFHETEPFFQVADLRTASGKVKEIELLVPDSANTTLFSLRRTIPALQPAEAARWVVHCQAFDISGIKSGAVGDARVSAGKGAPMGIGFAGWLGGITVLGDDLKQTMLLNLVLDAHAHPDDLPIWEQPHPGVAERVGIKAHGPASLFTWQQRRVRLIGNDESRITSVLIANGDPIDYQFQRDNEPMSAWRLSKPQSKKFGMNIYMPQQFEPGQQIWRGLNSLLPLISSEQNNPDHAPSKVLQWSAELAESDVLPRDSLTRIQTVGVKYGSQNSSWDEIFSDSLVFNVQLAGSGDFKSKHTVLDSVARTHEGVLAVQKLADNLQVAAGGDANRADELRDECYALLDQPFRDWLAAFSPQNDQVQQLDSWTATAHRELEAIANRLVKEAPPSAWVGRAVEVGNKSRWVSVGQAESWFRHTLSKCLPLQNDRGIDQ